MQTTLRQIVRGQKFSDRLFGGNLHHVLGMGQESAIHGDGAGHAHAFIFGDAVRNQDVFQGLLRRRHPQQQPAHIAQRHGIVVFHAKGSRIIQRAVADQKHRRQPVGSGDDQGFKAIHPARAAAAGERARVHRRRMFDDLELRVLTIGDDIFGVQFAVGDDFRNGIHHFRVGADRIRGDDVDVREANRLGDGLATVQ